MRSALSIIEPHLKPLLTEGSWIQQLVDQGPTLSINEDTPPPWGQARHPSMPGHPPRGPSTLSDSDQHTEGSPETITLTEGLEDESQKSSQTVDEALKGLMRLGWLLLCQARLAEAWHTTLRHSQQALRTSSFEVSAVDICWSAGTGVGICLDWAAWYIIWLLIKLMSKGVVFSFLSICSGGNMYCLLLYGLSKALATVLCPAAVPQ